MTKNYLDLLNKLQSLTFVKDDEEHISSDYIRLQVHIALELADKRRDWKAFLYIYNKYNKNEILQWHIQLTESVYGKWNYTEVFNEKKNIFDY